MSTVVEPLPAACLRHRDGTTIPLDVAGWAADADGLERRRLAELEGPVLDIGCGPGRLVVALAERGIPVLGVDASPVAVGLAQDRNAPALVRSVFDPLPGTGRWRSALLFDGNIGIGGDPARLLRRVAELLAVGGHALVETAPPGDGLRRFSARVERGEDASPWFPWARVGAEAVAPLAWDAGFAVDDVVEDEGRWFADLRRVAA
ncbi:MAG: methyltransferase domain-containing protein [Actinobacteria bacterium]|nr:methyltransferase domain-containing protein [Actinomycetota bacterium]